MEAKYRGMRESNKRKELLDNILQARDETRARAEAARKTQQLAAPARVP